MNMEKPETLQRVSLTALIDYARQATGEPGNVLDGLPTPSLRWLYAEAYEGEYSMNGVLGEELAETLPKEQLVEDLLFWLEAQI